MLLLGWFVIRRLALVMVNLSAKSAVSISTHYKDRKEYAKK